MVPINRLHTSWDGNEASAHTIPSLPWPSTAIHPYCVGSRCMWPRCSVVSSLLSSSVRLGMAPTAEAPGPWRPVDSR